MKPTISVGIAYAVAVVVTAAAFYFLDAWTGVLAAIICICMWRAFVAGGAICFAISALYNYVARKLG